MILDTKRGDTIEMRIWRLMELFFLTPICRNSQCEYNKQGHNLENSITTTFDNKQSNYRVHCIDHASYFNTLPLRNRHSNYNRQSNYNTVYPSENGKSTTSGNTTLTSFQRTRLNQDGGKLFPFAGHGDKRCH